MLCAMTSRSVDDRAHTTPSPHQGRARTKRQQNPPATVDAAMLQIATARDGADASAATRCANRTVSVVDSAHAAALSGPRRC
jgi:hypothetical protein